MRTIVVAVSHRAPKSTIILRLHYHTGSKQARPLVDGCDQCFNCQVASTVVVKRRVETRRDNSRGDMVLPILAGRRVANVHEMVCGNTICLDRGTFAPAFTSNAYLAHCATSVTNVRTLRRVRPARLWWLLAECPKLLWGFFVPTPGAGRVCVGRWAFVDGDGGGGASLDRERGMGVENWDGGRNVRAVGGMDGDMDGGEETANDDR